MPRRAIRTKAFLAVAITSAILLVTVPLVQAANPSGGGWDIRRPDVVPRRRAVMPSNSGPRPDRLGRQTTSLAALQLRRDQSESEHRPAHLRGGGGPLQRSRALPQPQWAAGPRPDFRWTSPMHRSTQSTKDIVATAGSAFSGVRSRSSATPIRARSSVDYTATITWGDGSSSAGTVQASGSGFAVTGAHTYANAGSDPLSVTVGDTGGASASASGTASVGSASTTSSTHRHEQHDRRPLRPARSSRCPPRPTRARRSRSTRAPHASPGSSPPTGGRSTARHWPTAPVRPRS